MLPRRRGKKTRSAADQQLALGRLDQPRVVRCEDKPAFECGQRVDQRLQTITIQAMTIQAIAIQAMTTQAIPIQAMTMQTITIQAISIQAITV